MITAMLLALVAALMSSTAYADGDPASDVLSQQSLFLPQDAGVSPDRQAQLISLLRTAKSDGYAIRVALIASSSDLGSVSALWRQPQNYAKFLGQELSIVYRGPLLVVMPTGLGFYDPRNPSAVSSVRASAAGSNLGEIALHAVQRLAASSGHSISIPTVTSSERRASSALTSWIVFVVGLLLVLAAWTASLRAKPLGTRGRTATET
jgi:hypothetical protein